MLYNAPLLLNFKISRIKNLITHYNNFLTNFYLLIPMRIAFLLFFLVNSSIFFNGMYRMLFTRERQKHTSTQSNNSVYHLRS